MSDKVTHLTQPDVNAQYRGHSYSIIADPAGGWNVKLILPMRPLKFEKHCDSKQEADKWMRSVIDHLEVSDEQRG